jgi:Uma2 family endonuclease
MVLSATPMLLRQIYAIAAAAHNHASTPKRAHVGRSGIIAGIGNNYEGFRMASQVKPFASAAEYLALERASEEKHEFFDGEIVAMTGASENHNLIVSNLVRELGVQLKNRGGKVYPSDMRVSIPAENRYVYPDVTVVTTESHFEDDRRDTLLNPQVVIEVLSDSTEAYDRGDKFSSYRTLPSVLDYVLVLQDRAQVEHFVRHQGEDWLLKTHRGLDAMFDLPAIGCRLALRDIYLNVPLD